MPLKNRSICVTYLKENVKFPIAHMHKVQVFIQAMLVSVTRHKKRNLTIEFWISIFIIYIFVYLLVFFFVRFCFFLFTELLEFVCSNDFSDKSWELSTYFKYAVVWLSMHLQHNIHDIIRHTKNENLKP